MTLDPRLKALLRTNERAKEYLKAMYMGAHKFPIELTETNTDSIADELLSDLSGHVQSVLIKYFETTEEALLTNPLSFMTELAQHFPPDINKVLQNHIQVLGNPHANPATKQNIYECMMAIAGTFTTEGFNAMAAQHPQPSSFPHSTSTAAASSPSSTPGLSETPNSMQSGASEAPLPPIVPAPAVTPSTSTGAATTATPTPTPSTTSHPVSPAGSDDNAGVSWLKGGCFQKGFGF